MAYGGLGALPPPLQGFALGREQVSQDQERQRRGALEQLQMQEFLRKSQQEQGFQSELSALGPNPTQEQLEGVLAKRDPMGLYKARESRTDRQAQRDLTREMGLGRLQQAANQLEMQNQFNNSRIAAIQDENARKREADAWKKQYEQGRLDIEKQLADLKKTVAENKPEKPIPPAIQDSFTGAMNSYNALDAIERNIGKSGVISGYGSEIQAKLGSDKGAIEFKTAVNNLKVQAQSIIKGIPSNFDVQTFIATMPSLTEAPNTNTERIKQTRQALDQIVKDTISYYKGLKYQIPDHIVAQAKARNIDLDSLKPWDGKGDPLASSQKMMGTSTPTSGGWSIRPAP